MMDVTLVTANAEVDDLSDSDYREIFEELRQGAGLRVFVDKIESAYSHATWGKWEKGDLRLNREMQNELRQAIGKQRRALTVLESMHNVDGNAEVWQVGSDATVHRVVKLATVRPVNISSNGTVSVRDHVETHVTTVTRRYRGNEKRRHRLTVSPANFAWLQDQGITADEAIAKLRGGA